MRRKRGGFTLVEVLVALAIAGVVLIGTRGLLDGLGMHATVAARAIRDADARENAERTARQIVGNVALAPSDAPTFVGTAQEASFDSWCPSRRAGLEPCHARLTVVPRTDGSTLELVLSTGDSVALLRGRVLALRYLDDAAYGGHWSDQWNATQTPPLAVAASSEHDALFLRIGERR